jgi:hypothetical protein
MNIVIMFQPWKVQQQGENQSGWRKPQTLIKIISLCRSWWDIHLFCKIFLESRLSWQGYWLHPECNHRSCTVQYLNDLSLLVCLFACLWCML